MPRYAVAGWLNKMVNISGKVYRSFGADAGTIRFDKVDSMVLWKIRYCIGKMVSDKAPAYKRALVDWETPLWDPKKLPDIGYVPVAPKVQSYMPDCISFSP